jgi:hypothetical protein
VDGASGVYGEVEREPGHDAVHAREGLPRCGGRHFDRVTRLSLLPYEVGHLHLDAAETWEVTVTDVQDPHQTRLAEAGTAIKPSVRRHGIIALCREPRSSFTLILTTRRC